MTECLTAAPLRKIRHACAGTLSDTDGRQMPSDRVSPVTTGSERKFNNYPAFLPRLGSDELKDPVAQPNGTRPADPKERREVRRAIAIWRRQISGDDRVPLVANFDFASIRGDWSHRFLICADQNPETAAFISYGATFAAQLGLPEKVTVITPLKQVIPEHYWPLFASGCGKAIANQEPAPFNGALEHDFTAELFRAVFLPIRLHPSWSKWLIFGTFNCRTVLQIDRRAADD